MVLEMASVPLLTSNDAFLTNSPTLTGGGAAPIRKKLSYVFENLSFQGPIGRWLIKTEHSGVPYASLFGFQQTNRAKQTRGKKRQMVREAVPHLTHKGIRHLHGDHVLPGFEQFFHGEGVG